MTVVELVDRERARLRRLEIAAGVGLAIGGSAIVVAAGAWLLADARWMTLPRGLPLIIWLAVVVVNALAGVRTYRAVARRTSRAAVAAAVERERSLRAGSLRAALEVANEGALGRRAAADVAATLPRGGRLAPAASSRTARLTSAAGAVAVVAIGGLAWSAPTAADGIAAIASPMRAWRGTLVSAPKFVNLPTHVVRGERLLVEVEAPRRATVTISSRSTGEGWQSHTVPVDRSTGVARLVLGAMRADVRVAAGDGRQSSDTAMVHVADRPFIGAVELRATYPAYLQRAPEALVAGEALRIPEGTRIDVSGRASTELTSTRLVSADASVGLGVHGYAFSGALVAVRSGTWTWAAVGHDGPIADVPAPIRLEVIPDSAPVVQLIAPASDTTVAPDEAVNVSASATDDHGLAAVELRSWVTSSGGGARPAESAALAQGVPAWTGAATLALGGRGLQPGDVVHVQVVARDASPRAQVSASRELLLRVPNTEEQRSLARAAADSAVSAATAAAQAQRALTQRTEELARERADRSRSSGTSGSDSRASGGDDKSMSYESAQRAKAVADDQKALMDRVQKLQSAANDLQKQLAQAGALDTSLARQLRDVQALLREAMTPELAAQMQKLQQASQQLQGDQARQALRDLAALQQKLREQLEHSAEMFRRAAMEGAMQTLRDEARELAQRDHRLADSSTADAATRQAEASALAQRTERFAADAQKLQERLAQEHANEGATRTGQAADRGQKAASQLSQASQQKSNASERSQAAANAASQMEQAAQAMSDAREKQVGAWKQELTSELDRAVQEALAMAREESALQQKAQSGGSSAGSGEDLRGQQSAIEQGLQTTAKRLDEQSRRTALLSGRSQRALGEAQQKVASATQSLREGRNAQSAGSLGEAADALNRAAAALARDREKANSASSATGFSEMLQQMQELAKKQGGINAQAQGLMPMMNGQPSPGAQATARALARQQRQVAQQLDELNDAAGQGDKAGQLAREARQLADALDAGRVDAATVARQQQLFRRLLDAGRSLEKDERDDSGKREAKAAVGAESVAPQNPQSSGRAALRYREPTWDELRGLTADERREILDYFRRINSEPKP